MAIDDINGNGQLYKIFNQIEKTMVKQDSKLDTLCRDVKFLVADVKDCHKDRNDLRLAVSRLKVLMSVISAVGTAGIGALFFFIFKQL